jgi:ABC-type nickel/cobalt efflux system permease component RcnA
MNSLDPQTMDMLAVVAVLVVLAIAVWFFWQRRQSDRLSDRFGPEYKHTVEELGSRPKAEAELRAREKRVEKFKIVPLSPAEADRFAGAWRALQGRFVDNPKGVLMEADALVRDLMQKRGYPMADFERRAADISVDHPHVVDHYRAAQAIAFLDRRGEADTEALRKAVVHYRALFDELLEVRSPQRDTREMEPIHEHR